LNTCKRVYEWALRAAPAPLRASALATSLLLGGVLPAAAQSPEAVLQDAREAYRKKDRNRLATLRATAVGERHLLAPWVDYWDLNSRLSQVQADEVEAFYRRWPGSYVEDRLRNDWLLELGRRRDWLALALDYPRFRMNDDREVACYAVLADHAAGKNVRDAARAAWLAQREADEGCTLLASTLFEAKQFTASDAWLRVRWAVDANRPRVARQAASLISAQVAQEVGEINDSAARYLARKKPSNERTQQELATLALMRLAASDPDTVAALLTSTWGQLPPELAAWAWATLGKQSALRLASNASDHYQQAALAEGKVEAKNRAAIEWPTETLAWKARAALRANGGANPRWQQVVQAINAMSEADQRDATWVYWKARALQAMAGNSSEPAAMYRQGQELFTSIAGQYHFYGSLAAEELGRPITLPTPPAALTPAEREAAAREPGLQRALALLALGLRSEGNREWNFTLRGMSDRALLAAAQLGCERELWDRCINTSDRTRAEVDMAQRFPMPFRKEMLQRTREIGLDAAYVYGLIRQESRFISDARSHVGASGLMQVMPTTARWTAKKIGVAYSADMITDRDTNLKIGTAYLKLVLDDLGGSQAMAAAAYNAGPSRPRRWREGAVVEPAIWAENIPFSETRDYVKKVLSNATFYAAVMSDAPQAPSLKQRLGKSIGPRAADAPPPDRGLP
jgi:soluble lytic murein transglycosylase